jgi:hypothetical protein
MLSVELRLIYERAVYEAELEAGRVTFRIDGAPEGRAPAETLAIITAWNPADLRPMHAVNERANERLADAIERLGFAHRPALGRSVDGRHTEPSFAVAGISRTEAVALGRRYAQAAVFFWDGKRARILSCLGG